jgi:hypothetical protein
VDAAISTVSPDLILSSNEVELGPAFRGLVLYSAINEEFAPQYLDKDELPDDLKLATRYFSNDNVGSNGSSDREAEHTEIVSTMRSGEKHGIGRNHPCSCGSGLRYKHCHGKIK